MSLVAAVEPLRRGTERRLSRPHLISQNRNVRKSSSLISHRKRTRQNFFNQSNSSIQRSFAIHSRPLLDKSLPLQVDRHAVSRFTERSAASVCKADSWSASAKRMLNNGSAVIPVQRCLQVQQHALMGRILQQLINSQSPLDHETLDSIFITADSVLFNRILGGRVGWQWSQPGQSRYDENLLGTTTLLHRRDGPDETIIILSKPIIQSGRYNRNLLLSVFLHELVHCYLFLCFGTMARQGGGHSRAFHDIADLISRWTRNTKLHLCNAKANLELFLSNGPEDVAFVDDEINRSVGGSDS